ncbi:sugar ABC transporter substrate-binding protein [Paraburkholderia caballeronis]|uniref:Monosaccharide ABC transporter substrate-binding protein, CUT2 family n=1 Tax=Paraburkholderia caballeronis TaxID=416943 RepID=A0A1H7F4K8_9BURK|nr:sugar ABC transporter substrate-binding protein [Paraburkholderia caballeronis]PXW23886.1 monosaccharide ABC transporter substrate-binding protein (CUT2 family) [Paraburkholderia caballeronis]PXW99650.1 monosaccharide ABC transporter substrate-binding protein (CUT2 family) [Paraburkholderia caballeronis]RAJ96604.1 monosaccharide ABC transporter substrate-binding protein (CUT2 family) [Paraburkholderia caballeronis]SEE79414.1 monosaccharide ABC transporter substrate-binding protein, CUT2 fami
MAEQTTKPQTEYDAERNEGGQGIVRATRRGLLQGAGLGAALSLLGAAGAGHGGLIGSALAAEPPFPAHKRWKIVFVNHVTTNPFFVPTQYGIQDAAELLGMDYQWTGSATSDAGEMVRAVNSAIAAKADAIAVPIVDPTAFDKPVQAALDAGIPVFAYNADAPRGSTNPRLAYIGQDLYLSGYQMGERIANLVDSGLVALFIATPGQLNIQPRLDGASDAIRKSGKKIDVQTVATGATVNEELSKIKAFYLGHQNLKGMFAVDAGSTQGVAEVMRESNLPAKGVHGGGFDLLPRTIQLIHDGYLDFTIDQQPYVQGFYAVVEAFVFLASGGLVGPGNINTGLKFVTKSSVDPYLNTSTRYEGKTTKAQIVPMSGAIKS